MDWLDRMNAALDCIEANLAGDINLQIVAQKACCSVYHFTRIFSFITGIPLNEYIRRRRLTLAGFELLNSDVKIIDLALKYGYDSPNSFTRAFQAMHGVIPSVAHVPGVELRSFARISFIISIKGDMSMNYRIVEERASKVFGKSLITNWTDAYQTVPALWDKCEENRTTYKIVEVGHGNEKTLLNAVIFAGEIEWLISQQGKDGFWDFGAKLNICQLSDHWRNDIHRKMDQTVYILCILRNSLAL